MRNDTPKFIRSLLFWLEHDYNQHLISYDIFEYLEHRPALFDVKKKGSNTTRERINFVGVSYIEYHTLYFGAATIL